MSKQGCLDNTNDSGQTFISLKYPRGITNQLLKLHHPIILDVLSKLRKDKNTLGAILTLVPPCSPPCTSEGYARYTFKIDIKPSIKQLLFGRQYELKIYSLWFRTVKDIKVLEQCEIHPTRTEFVEELGEGAFGRVHKATLKDGLNFFKNDQDFFNKARRQKIVAVKELHGECEILSWFYVSWIPNVTDSWMYRPFECDH